MNFLENEARIRGENLHPGGHETTKALLEWLDLSQDQLALEIGCGTGATATRLIRESGCRVIAMDYMPEMLRAAQLRFKNNILASQVLLTYANANAPLPFSSSCFDAVYAESVIALLEVRRVLQECARVLCPGGRLALTERIWKSETSYETITATNLQSRALFGIPAATAHPRDRDSWVDTILKCGFLNIQIVPVDHLLTNNRFPQIDLWGRLKRARHHIRHPITLVRSLMFRLLSKRNAQLWQNLESFVFLAEKPAVSR